MVDIYEYAQKYNVDYMDDQGNIYMVEDYNRALRHGLATDGIKVYDYEGNYLGIAQQKN